MLDSDYDNIVAEIIDVASSGTGGELGPWHYSEFEKVLAPLSNEEKQELFNLLKEEFETQEGWQLAEIKWFMKNCNVTDYSFSFRVDC